MMLKIVSGHVEYFGVFKIQPPGRVTLKLNLKYGCLRLAVAFATVIPERPLPNTLPHYTMFLDVKEVFVWKVNPGASGFFPTKQAPAFLLLALEVGGVEWSLVV